VALLPCRLAAAADAAAVAALVNSAYRGDSSCEGWTTEAHLLAGQRVDADWIVEIISAPGSVMLLHEQGGAPIACVHLERTGEDCYLGMLTIKPTLQGGGLGRQLLEAAEAWAVAHWTSRSMHMTVLVQRPELLAWYERRGYSRSGTRKPFPYGDTRYGLPKRDDLEFEVLRKPLQRP
jgi:GNAT superfamily N-acetyltransferase